ncbi:alpha/beta fold hydrolase [Pontixanthobacter aquaemixtae]|uniref:Alpha/beta fold hydrolase n=1 Tax=Pontixanthobacter aquaemixtae TaxID=1958940 RepID=A0A844ZXJ8_9SPHN|nr:alpha/beta hydrolase [Pontixanthobacter aquaemixtae]MXO91666.1 alpha/beta fold hydrolase [Pontixanthobacter aquaemixtae]
MPQITANGITIEYDEHGEKDAPPVLLIMGFGAQMTLWPMEFVEAMVERGFRVIRYDNRDVGLSHKFDGVKAPGLIKLTLLGKFGITPKVPYTLSDMANDGAGVLDALGIDKAHIVGASMGGMIAQHFAAKHADRTLSLTSIFSTTGNPKLPAAKKEAMKVLITRPASLEEDALVAHGMKLSRTIGSPAYPADEDKLRERVTASVRRSVYPEGGTRHLSAIVADGDRRAMNAGITASTLVLHGEDDPLVPVDGGRDTAASIPGAKIKTFPGWGHDLPTEMVQTLADEIAAHAKAA